MIIKVLVENTSVSKKYGCEHGLSLYIGTKNKKILFDVGASELFYKNAKKLDIRIEDIDYLIISHGHYDHGGGLRKFFIENKTAEVFIHKIAFKKYYAMRQDYEKEYIGLDEKLKNNRQIIYTSDRFFIDKGIQIFSNVKQKKPLPLANSGLLEEKNDALADDLFMHEQNLIIEEDGKSVLFTGCAHNGIENILEHFYILKGRMPDYVIGGFHLSRSSGLTERDQVIDKIGNYLLGTGAKYYTCHCTGVEAYNRLKSVMGHYIDYLPTGTVFEV